MELLPKSTVVLVLFVLWVPLAFCRNATSSIVSNETVPPTLSLPPSTPPATPTTTESLTTAGSWFFWRRSVGSNGTVHGAEMYAPHTPVNTTTNVTGTPDAEVLVTRSSDTSTMEMSSSAQPEAYFEATSKHSDDGNSTEPAPAASTNAVRNLSGTRADPESFYNVAASSTPSESFDVRSTAEVSTTSDAPPAAPFTDAVRDPPGAPESTSGSFNMTESTTTFQSLVVPSTTEATFPTTSSAPEDTDATSDGSCLCHDTATATPSTSAQPVTTLQQAQVTLTSEDESSTPSVVPSSTGSQSVSVHQTPAQTSTTTTRAPNYIV